MVKPVIVTRAGKGSALTFTEGDANFTNLQDATISVTDGVTTSAIDLNGTISFAAGGDLSVYESNGTITYAFAAVNPGIDNIVEDTTPQLGGDLDVQENKLFTTSSTVPITIEGYVDPGFNFDLETNIVTGVTPSIHLDGVVALNDAGGFGVGIITGQAGVGLYLGTNLLDISSPYMNMLPDGTIEIFAQGSTPGIDINADGGDVLIQAIAYPATDGTAGQVMVTDGEGVLSFEDRVASADVLNIVNITQGDYDLLSPPVATTLYIIEEV